MKNPTRGFHHFHATSTVYLERAVPPANRKNGLDFDSWTMTRSCGLAQAIVAQIQASGPFTSMSEFVNRRLGPETDDTSLRGPLQQAIVDAGLNDNAASPRQVTAADAAAAGYANQKAAIGDTEDGASYYLTLGDLLSVIGSVLTVRSDTFVIRSYGESRDSGGIILASAICEAVVQRYPDFLDKTNLADDGLATLTPVNARFGRRFHVVSFRWINPGEN